MLWVSKLCRQVCQMLLSEINNLIYQDGNTISTTSMQKSSSCKKYFFFFSWLLCFSDLVWYVHFTFYVYTIQYLGLFLNFSNLGVWIWKFLSIITLKWICMKYIIKHSTGRRWWILLLIKQVAHWNSLMYLEKLWKLRSLQLSIRAFKGCQTNW